MCLSIEVAVWVVYYLFGFNGKIHADFCFPFSFKAFLPTSLLASFRASGKGCLDVAYEWPLPPSPFLCIRSCPGTDRSGFCWLYTISHFPLRAKALLRKEKLLPFLCAASPPSGNVSRSGCRREGQSMGAACTFLRPHSAPCHLRAGRNTWENLAALPHWDCFLPAGVIFSSLSFFFPPPLISCWQNPTGQPMELPRYAFV